MIDAYSAAGSPVSIWRQLYTDLVFRAPVLKFLGQCARAGTPTWGYEFAHPIDSADGGSPHATDVPFVFGTHAHPHFSGKIGDPASAAATSASMMSDWVSFVRDGQPAPDGANAWPRFDPDQPAVLQFVANGETRATAVERPSCLDRWPAYR